MAGDITMSALSQRYRTMRGSKTPPGFHHFCRAYLKLSGSEMDRLWKALSQCFWSAVVELRSAILCLATLPESQEAVHAYLIGPLQPGKLIYAIECLYRCGELSRAEASAIEEKVLAKVGPRGEWI